MNILLSRLNFETKNLLVQQLIENIKKQVMNPVTQLLLNFSPNRYIHYILNLQKTLNEIIKNLIVKYIHTIDSSYKDSDIRKDKYYINKSNVPRTIYTIF